MGESSVPQSDFSSSIDEGDNSAVFVSYNNAARAQALSPAALSQIPVISSDLSVCIPIHMYKQT
jgi:hypothetical protein